jgi:hypothetical protein
MCALATPAFCTTLCCEYTPTCVALGHPPASPNPLLNSCSSSLSPSCHLYLIRPILDLLTSLSTPCCLLLILPPQVDPAAPCCFSCGRPLKAKEAAAAKEQHNRCSDCQSRHEAGQHCGVCSRVWFDYESDRMATCSRCSGRVHEACDPKAARAVQAAAAAEVRPHECTVCVVSRLMLSVRES